jgi:microcystin-dependent protein
MQNPFVGQITFYPYNYAPKGWATCEGQLLPIQQNTALFSLIGVNFGGNGTSTFALPDLRGRVSLGMGQNPGGSYYTVGEDGGFENVTLIYSQMPAHSHSLNASTTQGTVDDPSNALFSAPYVGGGRHGGGSTGDIYNPGAANTQLVPTTLAPAGNQSPHNNIQPTLVLTPCIALVGVFPTRN